MDLREIAWELNDKSITTARVGRWHGRTIKYMLENPLYKCIIKATRLRIRN